MAKTATTGTSVATLAFESTTFDVVTRNSQPWLRVGQIAQALGYTDERDCNKLHARNADEFTDSMTALVKLPTVGGEQLVRVFSLRGAHLLGMFSRTDKAAAFRKWVLDIMVKDMMSIANRNNNGQDCGNDESPLFFAMAGVER